MKNQKGYTLFEMIITIAVSSIVLLMLTQMLSMNLLIRQSLEDENRLFYASNAISENLQKEIFDMKAQSIELDPASTTDNILININHDYDIIISEAGVLSPDYTTAFTKVLQLDLTNNQISFDGVLLHDGSFNILSGSEIRVENLNPAICTSDPTLPLCDQQILVLDLIIEFQFNNGRVTESQRYVTTIIL